MFGDLGSVGLICFLMGIGMLIFWCLLMLVVSCFMLIVVGLVMMLLVGKYWKV